MVADFFASAFWTGFLWPLIIMVAESVLLLVVLLIAILSVVANVVADTIDRGAGGQDRA